ncbi:hydrophobic surface binding protein A-domain-containing protein [Aspergillus ambiguus]|uniref:cell wall mannoprotein 1 family protein n=1 Tax=Aspergillus ambiguus TaxID=176160 RepID=UPI003CCE3C5F
MKFFSTVLVLSLVATSIAEPIAKAKRALADYEAVIQSVSDQVAVVKTTVGNYATGSVDGAAVQDASDDLVAVINKGTTTVNGLAALTSIQALGLVTPIQDLADAVGTLIDDLIAAKPDFVADGLDDDVLASLQEQKTASQALADAISAKVPAALQEIADELSSQIITEIQRGIDAYS